MLIVYKPGGTPADKVSIPLPVTSWRTIGTSSQPGYKYRDPGHLAGPVHVVALRKGRLTVKGKGAQLYGLGNAPQGSLAVRLQLGSGVEFCALAPARPPEIRNDTTLSFVGVPHAPAPVSCPPVP